MSTPPDQFQRRTFVRLPYADQYLAQEIEGKNVEELNRALKRPWLTVQISTSIVKSTQPISGSGSWSKVDAASTSPPVPKPPQHRLP